MTDTESVSSSVPRCSQGQKGILISRIVDKLSDVAMGETGSDTIFTSLIVMIVFVLL